jgi:hypothetical protein
MFECRKVPSSVVEVEENEAYESIGPSMGFL